MVDLNNKEYVVVLQCDIVKQRCPGVTRRFIPSTIKLI